jgi:alpha-1,2-mannosyltransferase
MVGDALLNAIGRVEAGLSRHKRLSDRQRLALEVLMWLPVMAAGLSRTVALSKYYTAPFHVYTQLSVLIQQHQNQASRRSQPTTNVVCTCGEWYRFPSTFFLASDSSRPLRFLPGSFTGQLPQPFAPTGSRPSSLAHLQPFRDDNGMNPERFVALDECDWIVELEGGDCNVTLPDSSTVVYRHPFLDAAQTTLLHRVMYLPGLHESAVARGEVSYQDYVLYKIAKTDEQLT